MKEMILKILSGNKVSKIDLYKMLGVDICQTSNVDALLEDMIENKEIVYKNGYYKLSKKKEIDEDYVYNFIKSHHVRDFEELAGRINISRELLDEYLKNLEKNRNVVYAPKYGYGIAIKAKLVVRGDKIVAFDVITDKKYYLGNMRFRNFFSEDIALIVPYDYDDALLYKVVEHKINNLTGLVRLNRKKNTYFLVPTNPDYNAIDINKGDLNGAKEGDIVYTSLTYKSRITAKIEKIIGNMNDKYIEYFEVAYSYGFDNIFPDDVINECDDIKDNVEDSELVGRADYTNLKVITIDGDDSKDFDDAISVEKIGDNYKLYVFIADVANYVKEGMPLDKEALKRGTSVYFANQVIPMLPAKLSNGICSLNEGVIRLVMALEINLDSKGELIDYDIKEGFIKSAHRMTYNNVNKILSGDAELINKYNDIYQMLLDSNELAKKIRANRNKHGAITFDSTEYGFTFNDNGEPIESHKRIIGDGEQLIEDFMLQANYVVAYHMNLLGLPIVYRVHEKPEPMKVQAICKELKDMGMNIKSLKNDIHPKEIQRIIDSANETGNGEIVSNLLLKSMQKAYYSAECLGHYALQLEYYCHFTSPIRRYPDLMTHRMIKKLLLHPKDLNNDIIKYTTLIDSIAKENSESEQNATKVEWDVEDMLFGKIARRLLHKTFIGKVTSVMNFGVFVKLDNGIEGLISSNDMYDEENESFVIGQEVEVIITSVDPKYRVNFMLKEDYDAFREEYMFE